MTGKIETCDEEFVVAGTTYKHRCTLARGHSGNHTSVTHVTAGDVGGHAITYPVAAHGQVITVAHQPLPGLSIGPVTDSTTDLEFARSSLRRCMRIVEATADADPAFRITAENACAQILDEVRKALARPRDDDRVVADLRRQLGEEQARVILDDMTRTELATIKASLRLMQAQLASANTERDAVIAAQVRSEEASRIVFRDTQKRWEADQPVVEAAMRLVREWARDVAPGDEAQAEHDLGDAVRGHPNWKD